MLWLAGGLISREPWAWAWGCCWSGEEDEDEEGRMTNVTHSASLPPAVLLVRERDSFWANCLMKDWVNLP